MDAAPFDTLTVGLTRRLSRRRGVGLLGLLGAGALALPDEASAKKKRPKKKPLCLNGQTVKASGKKRKKLLKQGATPGACSPAGPCSCASNEVCHEGVCQPCTVTCSGDAIACGSALQQRLLDGGTVYACPGRYQGQFTMGTARLIGAGNGDNPATSTILDGGGIGRTLDITAGGLAELFAVRITGGRILSDSGGGIRLSSGELRLTNSAVVANEAGSGGGGINADGPVRLTNAIVSGNKASYGGGLRLFGTSASFITDSLISGNESTNGAGNGGGGLLSSVSSLTIVGTEISGNKSYRGAGGIETFDGNITLNSACRVVNNTLSNGAAGGIYVSGSGSVAVNGATVSGNTNPQCVGTACPS
ncbi:MAG: right-handed parallel beta-helix repeat-containing protein [Thermomicrobiales bacterium]